MQAFLLAAELAFPKFPKQKKIVQNITKLHQLTVPSWSSAKSEKKDTITNPVGSQLYIIRFATKNLISKGKIQGSLYEV